MIIAISGRKNSGKSCLASYLEDKGYIKISFATEVKRLASELYNIAKEYFYDQAKKEHVFSSPVYWNKYKAIELANLIGEKDWNKLYTQDFELNTPREILQILGTDVLRKYDPDFHVKSLKKYIEADKNYVLDDVRFKNELTFLKSINAFCIFVIRPYYLKDYSNHRSEIDLNRSHFDHIIINDYNKKAFLNKFRKFMYNIDIMEVFNISTITDKVKACNYNLNEGLPYELKRICDKCLIPVIQDHCEFNHNAFLIDAFDKQIFSVTHMFEKLIKISEMIKIRGKYVIKVSSLKYNDVLEIKDFLKSKREIVQEKAKYTLLIKSPFIIEDMKLWDWVAKDS